MCFSGAGHGRYAACPTASVRRDSLIRELEYSQTGCGHRFVRITLYFTYLISISQCIRIQYHRSVVGEEQIVIH